MCRLRHRAENSHSVMKGRDIVLDECLLIHPRPDRLDEFLAQLAQPK